MIDEQKVEQEQAQEKPKKKERKIKFTIFSDFKAFISRGNIMDLAVAVIIGGAFGKIVTSLVNDIIMPVISLIIGGLNLSALEWTMKADAILKYGAFIQSIVDFLIIAICIFLVVRIVSNAQRKLNQLQNIIETKTGFTVDKPVEAPKPTQEELLVEIRDLLRKQLEAQNKAAQSDQNAKQSP